MEDAEFLFVCLFVTAISINCLGNFLCFVLNYTAGDLLSKKGKCKTFRFAKLCHQCFSQKHYWSYKEHTPTRKFWFCIVAAPLIFQSKAAAGRERRGRAGGGGGCAGSGRARSCSLRRHRQALLCNLGSIRG